MTKIWGDEFSALGELLMISSKAVKLAVDTL
jgi:hypothetical protein